MKLWYLFDIFYIIISIFKSLRIQFKCELNFFNSGISLLCELFYKYVRHCIPILKHFDIASDKYLFFWLIYYLFKVDKYTTILKNNPNLMSFLLLILNDLEFDNKISLPLNIFYLKMWDERKNISKIRKLKHNVLLVGY